jgi:catechol 2,3-dioxygenase-like lactoylglutathione lyase family enzyme
MATVSVRYIVHDVEEAIAFYTEHLGFGVEFNPRFRGPLARRAAPPAQRARCRRSGPTHARRAQS